MSFINDKYFQSKHIKIFPSSFRGNYIKQGDTNQITIDPEARLNTEANFVQPKSDIGKNTYIIEYDKTSNIIKFILGGYYFEISEIDKYINELAGKEIGIKLRDIKLKESDEADSERITKLLDSWEESNSEDILDMSIEIEQVVYYYFTGLKVLGENDIPNYRIKLFNDDKSLCKEKLLPKIDHGTGDNTLIHGEGLAAAYANQTVIGKYNDNKFESIFEIGVGVSDANRQNAVEVNSKKTTLNNNVDITNTLTVKKNLTVNGASELDGKVEIKSTTASTNTLSGALVVAGGVGIGDGVNIANTLNVGDVVVVKKNPTKDEQTVKVGGSLRVTGNSDIAGSATIATDKITLSKPLEITDESTDALKVSGDTTIAKNLSVGDDTTKVFEVKPTITETEKNVTVNGTFSAGNTSVSQLTVSGATTINGTTSITGGVNINQSVSEPSLTNINGTTNITGDVNIAGAVNINQSNEAQDVKINGNVAVTGKLTSTYTEYVDDDTTVLTTKSYVDNKVNALTLAKTGGDGKYVKLISQTNGQVAVTTNDFETTFNAETNNNAPTSAAVDNYTSGRIAKLWDEEIVHATEINVKDPKSLGNTLREVILNAAYPIGSIYTYYSSESLITCPIETTLGGTWEKITTGTFLCAASSENTSKYFVGSTGGSADSIVVKHTHEYSSKTFQGQTDQAGSHSHTVSFKASRAGTGNWTGFEGNAGNKDKGSVTSTTNISDPHTHTFTFTLPSISEKGEAGTDKNLPPYIAVYMWKRTA